MRAPVISESGIDSGHGVTITPPAMRRCAARISDSVTNMKGAITCTTRREKQKPMRAEDARAILFPRAASPLPHAAAGVGRLLPPRAAAADPPAPGWARRPWVRVPLGRASAADA